MGWEGFMEMEKRALAERRNGRLRIALGGEPSAKLPEELERLALDDESKAEAGLVQLKVGDRTCYKHIDNLTFNDAPARIAAEREQIAWLKKRLGK